MNEVSRSGKRALQPRHFRIIMIFHVVHLHQELRLCVHFQMSMQLFVRMIPLQATHSQPVVKKAPPSMGRQMPSGFYSDKEPPRIGNPVQPPPPPTDAAQGLNLPLAATPMTPGYPPRPPIDALPKHPSMETGSGANKHPLEQPVQQGPPHKHVRPKAFPREQSASQTSMAAPSSADMFRPGTPCPKGPPAAHMPAPPEVTSMPTEAFSSRSRVICDREW